MSSGACVIASKIGGIPEILEDNGILINDINNEKLSTNINNLIKDNKKRQNYQQRAWKNFKFSSDISSEKLDLHRKFISSSYF